MKNKTITRLIKREMKRYEKERKRCVKSYPDWRDDEFNMLDNKFIWGFNSMGEEPSFSSWNDAYIYYNRANKKYYLEIDTLSAQGELDRLFEIKVAFRNFLIENEIPRCADFSHFQDMTLEADSLTELYTKFEIQCAGYSYYCKTFKSLENI